MTYYEIVKKKADNGDKECIELLDNMEDNQFIAKSKRITTNKTKKHHSEGEYIITY